MTTTLRHSTRVAPGDVRDTLSSHVLVDGYHLVQDIEKSHGVWLHDAARGRDMLDFFGHFSTNPIGFNHPKLADDSFRSRILPSALNKPANSDVYTSFLAEFVETFARVVPESFRRHLFFIEGGALAVENALKAAFDWKVRKNLAAGRGETRHPGPALPAGLPRPQRLHALADQHRRPAQDPVLPEVRLAAHRQPEAALPDDGRSPGRGRADRRPGGGRDRALRRRAPPRQSRR